jgi:hypothetical protein
MLRLASRGRFLCSDPVSRALAAHISAGAVSRDPRQALAAKALDPLAVAVIGGRPERSDGYLIRGVYSF